MATISFRLLAALVVACNGLGVSPPTDVVETTEHAAESPEQIKAQLTREYAKIAAQKAKAAESMVFDPDAADKEAEVLTSKGHELELDRHSQEGTVADAKQAETDFTTAKSEVSMDMETKSTADLAKYIESPEYQREHQKALDKMAHSGIDGSSTDPIDMFKDLLQKKQTYQEGFKKMGSGSTDIVKNIVKKHFMENMQKLFPMMQKSTGPTSLLETGTSKQELSTSDGLTMKDVWAILADPEVKAQAEKERVQLQKAERISMLEEHADEQIKKQKVDEKHGVTSKASLFNAAAIARYTKLTDAPARFKKAMKKWEEQGRRAVALLLEEPNAKSTGHADELMSRVKSVAGEVRASADEVAEPQALLQAAQNRITSLIALQAHDLIEKRGHGESFSYQCKAQAHPSINCRCVVNKACSFSHHEHSGPRQEHFCDLAEKSVCALETSASTLA